MRHVSNILTGLFAVALGALLILWIIPAQTVPAIFASVPSGFYPMFTSGMLIASGLALAISGLFTKASKEPGPSGSQIATRFVVALVLLCGAMFAAPHLGFWQTGIAICFITLLLMRENRWHLIAIISLAAPILVWSVFEILLGRPLP